MQNLDWSVLVNALISIVPALICITFHELSHGYVAYRLGDNTAKSMGRLTLNPIKHIDVFGLLMMAIFKFGWAKPVPVNMMKFRRPKRDMAITALAGPVSNLVLAVPVLIIFGLVCAPLGGRITPFGVTLQAQTVGRVVLEMIYRTAFLSVALAVFNLIPIPPLDGSKVLFSIILPDRYYYKLMRYERFGMILLILVIMTNLFGETIGMATSTLFDKLFYLAETAYKLVN